MAIEKELVPVPGSVQPGVLPVPKEVEHTIRISNGEATAGINPQGGIVRSWKVDNKELLFSHPDQTLRLRASHPIGPVCGILYDPATRERNGQYVIDGRTFKLPLHGGLREADWTPVPGSQGNKVGLEYANTPEAPLTELMKTQFPFYFGWELGVELPNPHKLLWDLSFKNLTPNKIAPVDMRWHLYLPFEKGLAIQGLDGLEYTNNTVWDAPSTGTILGPGAFGEVVDRDWQICASGRRKFDIIYPNSQYTLRMEILSPTADSIVVWTKPPLGIGDFICVEPWLHQRNSVNNGTAQQVSPMEKVNLKVGLEFIRGK